MVRTTEFESAWVAPLTPEISASTSSAMSAFASSLYYSIFKNLDQFVSLRRRLPETLQAVIPAHTWFGARVEEPDSFTLIGCTVAPGFDFADFELARREDLLRLHPDHKELVEQLT